MTENKKGKRLAKEIFSIVAISAIVGLIYNQFSGKGIDLIRKEAQKIQAADSVLFPGELERIDSSLIEQPDTSVTNKIKVIAPLHEKALRNQDSSALALMEDDGKYYSSVSLTQLRRLLDEKRGVLIDARNAEDYIQGHIGGAVNVPALEMEKHFSDLVVIPRDTILLIYCNNAECHLAEMLSDFLRELEFKNIYIYEDGWDGWVEAGLPVSKRE